MTKVHKPGGRLIATIRKAATALADVAERELVERFGGDVELDLRNSRVMFSDPLIGRFIRNAAANHPDVEVLEFGWDGTAYSCRLRRDGRVMAARDALGDRLGGERGGRHRRDAGASGAGRRSGPNVAAGAVRVVLRRDEVWRRGAQRGIARRHLVGR